VQKLDSIVEELLGWPLLARYNGLVYRADQA
jgi:hypothetical protein